MRSLLSIPLPLLLILSSLVSFDSQALLQQGFEQSRGQSINDISFVNSHRANGTNSKIFLSRRYARSSENDKPVVDEEIDKLSLVELEKRYKEAEEAYKKMNDSVDTAKAAWEQKKSEAVGPNEEYERKKKEWEEMDAAAYKEEREKDKAKAEFNKATENYKKIKINFTATSKALNKTQEDLAKAREDLENIKGASIRLPNAETELSMNTEAACTAKDTDLPTLKEDVETAQGEYDTSDRLVEVQKGVVARCTTTCVGDKNLLSGLETKRDRKKDALKTANDTYIGKVSESSECWDNHNRLKAEVAALKEYVVDTDGKIKEKTTLISELEAKEPTEQKAFDAVKPEFENAETTLGEKKTAYEAAKEEFKQNPKDTEKLAAEKAAMDLVPLKEAKLKYDEDIENLKKDYDELKNKRDQEYLTENSKFNALKQVYEEKKNKKEPATGSTTTIAVCSVIGVLILAGIGAAVFFFLKRRKGKKEGDKPSGANGPSGGDASILKPGSESAASNAQAKEGSSKGSDQSNPTPSATPATSNTNVAPTQASGSNTNVNGTPTAGSVSNTNESATQVETTNVNPATSNTDLITAAAATPSVDQDAVTPQDDKSKFYKHVSLSELPVNTNSERERKAHIEKNIKNTKKKIRVYGKNEIIGKIKKRERCWKFTNKKGGREKLFRNNRTLKKESFLVSMCQNVHEMEVINSVEVAANGREAWIAKLRTIKCEPGTFYSHLNRVVKVQTHGRFTKEEFAVLEEHYKDMNMTISFTQYCIREFAKERKEEARKQREQGRREQAGRSDENSDKRQRSDKSPPRSDEEESSKSSPRSRKESDVRKGAKSDRKNSSKKARRSREKKKAGLRRKSGSIDFKDVEYKLNTRTKAVRNIKVPKDAKKEHQENYKRIIKKLGLDQFDDIGPHVQKPQKEMYAEMRNAFRDTNSFDKPTDDHVDQFLDHLDVCIAKGEKCDIKNLLTTRRIHGVLAKVTEEFSNEAQVVYIPDYDEINVVGDLHGNPDDLWRIIYDCGGRKSEQFKHKKFIFQGDYVDRGKHSLEVILYLLCLKIKYPKQFTVLRGNHEAYEVFMCYGFGWELTDRFEVKEGTRMANHFACCFETMPCAAATDDYWFSHGGMPKRICSIEEINMALKCMNPNDHETGRDTMWADAVVDMDETEDSPRGASMRFGPEHIKRFLAKIARWMMSRGHQKVPNGYEICSSGGKALLVTVFSASDYEGSGSSGAYMTIIKGGPCAFTIFYPHRRHTDDECRSNLDNNQSFTIYAHNSEKPPVMATVFKDDESVTRGRDESMGQKPA